jgi:fatty acid desaturase
MEHNRTHHYRLGEVDDPDLVENNLIDLRKSDAPLAVKYGVVFFFMMTWKWFYYAPNTYKCLKFAEMRRQRKITKQMQDTIHQSVTVKGLLQGYHPWLSLSEFLVRVVGPMMLYNFVILPLPVYYLFGAQCYKYALINLVLTDILTNMHSFLAIVTNHAGDDLYRFDTYCRANSPTFFLRAVISSANFSSGTDVVDCLHGWLNYQIEHHAWPFLSMRSYQKAQPMVQQICKKYGVPYVKHNVFWRLKKTVDIMVGNNSMRRWPEGVVDQSKDM